MSDKFKGRRVLVEGYGGCFDGWDDGMRDEKERESEGDGRG